MKTEFQKVTRFKSYRAPIRTTDDGKRDSLMYLKVDNKF